MPLTGLLMAHRMVRVSGWLLGSVLLLGADWSSCQSDLKRLRSRASEACDRASGTRGASVTMETRKRELDDCRATERNGSRAPSDAYDGARK
jgi:hypothetical protein